MTEKKLIEELPLLAFDDLDNGTENEDGEYVLMSETSYKVKVARSAIFYLNKYDLDYLINKLLPRNIKTFNETYYSHVLVVVKLLSGYFQYTHEMENETESSNI